jgi:RHS repeat-associated protein
VTNTETGPLACPQGAASLNTAWAPIAANPQIGKFPRGDGASNGQYYTQASMAALVSQQYQLFDALDSSVPLMGVAPANQAAMTDLCGIGNFDDQGSKRYCFSPGVDLGAGSPYASLQQFYWRVRVFDANDDGRDDLIAYAVPNAQSIPTAAFRVWFDATGTKHVDSLSSIPIAQGDFNGDGISDFLGGTAAALANGQLSVLQGSQPFGDQMSWVQDEGTARPSEIVGYSQAVLPDESSKQCSWPEACVRKAMHLATQHLVYQGPEVGNYRTLAYTYDDPRVDLQGAGFLGFGSILTWEPDVPRETSTLFDNTWDSGIHGVYRAFLPQVVTTSTPTAAPTPSCSPQSVNARIVTQSTSDTVQLINTPPSRVVHPTANWLQESEGPMTVTWCPVAGSPHFVSTGTSTLLATHFGTLIYDCDSHPSACFENVVNAVAFTQGGDSVEVATTYYPATTTSDWIVANAQTVQTTSTTQANGSLMRTAGVAYDPVHPFRPSSVTIEPESTDRTIWQSTGTTYDADGLPNVLTSYSLSPVVGGPTMARVTTITYDPDEGIFPRTVTEPIASHFTQILYHPVFGVPVMTLDANNVGTYTTLYDLGRPQSVWRDSGEHATYAYSQWLDGNGHVLGTQVDTIGTPTGAGGRGLVPTRVQRDAFGRVWFSGKLAFSGSWAPGTAFDGNWNVSGNVYDILGRLVSFTRPGSGAGTGTSHNSYDPLGRLTSTLLPDGNSIGHTYYQNWFEGRFDQLYNESYVERDADGRVTSSTQVEVEPNYNIVTTSYAYGPFDTLTQVTDPKGATTKMGYDLRGRQTSILDLDRGLTSTIYDGYGGVVGTNRDGFTSAILRDPLGRVTEQSDADGLTQFVWDQSLSGVGAPSYSISPDGTREDFAYDVFGRPSQTTWTVPNGANAPEVFSITTGYDSYGRLSQVTYPAVPGRATQFRTQETYTGTGYLSNVAEVDTAPSQTLWSVFSRNPDGTLATGARGNNALEVRNYDTMGRLQQMISGYLFSPPLESFSYTYDADGRVETRTDAAASGRTDTYTYDSLNRLMGWQLTSAGNSNWESLAYGYDVTGNLSTVTNAATNVTTETDGYGIRRYCVNVPVCSTYPHALTSVTTASGTVRYGYDARGRQISAPTRANVTYTEFDLPRSLTDAYGDVTAFYYDASGQRIKKVNTPVSPWAPGAGDAITTLGSLFERRETPQGTTDVFYVPGSDGVTAQVTFNEAAATNTVEYVHTDKMGTPTVISNSAGAVNERMYDDPFGQHIDFYGDVLSPSGIGGSPNTASGDVRIGFTGQEKDDEMGLVNMRGRMYDPAARHLLSADPHVTQPANAQSYNRYSYVMNNPTNLTDPSGYDPGPDLPDGYCWFNDCSSYFPDGGGASNPSVTQGSSGSPGSQRAPQGLPGGAQHNAHVAYAPQHAIAPATPALQQNGGSMLATMLAAQKYGVSPGSPIIPYSPSADRAWYHAPPSWGDGFWSMSNDSGSAYLQKGLALLGAGAGAVAGAIVAAPALAVGGTTLGAIGGTEVTAGGLAAAVGFGGAVTAPSTATVATVGAGGKILLDNLPELARTPMPAEVQAMEQALEQFEQDTGKCQQIADIISSKLGGLQIALSPVEEGAALPLREGISSSGSPWGAHFANIVNGVVVDGDLGLTFASRAAWVEYLVGDAAVHVSTTTP